MGLFDRLRAKRDEAAQAASATGDADELEPDDADTALVDQEAGAQGEAVSGQPEDEDEFAKEAPLDRKDKGPWDAAEDPGEDNRIDLGALQVPVIDGLQFQLETAESGDEIMAVSVVHRESKLQLQAFAAPKTEGLWGEVRAALAEGIESSGGRARETFTTLGNELAAKLPVSGKGGRTQLHPARFMGVDGPRWFLRGVLTGAALDDEDIAAEFEAIFRGVVVQRGTGAMPPRDVLLLSPPNVEADEETEVAEDLNPFERGPEITEVR